MSEQVGRNHVRTSLREGRWLVLVGAFTGLSLGVGCSIDDDDRCADGFVWDDEFRVCLEDAGGTGGSGGSDPGGGGSTGDPELGSSCVSDDDCDGAEDDATYCLLDPRNPSDPGVCTIPDCTADACGDDYSCCDCGSVDLVDWPAPLCLLSDRSSQLEGIGCTCE